jgi:hypothetical protein
LAEPGGELAGTEDYRLNTKASVAGGGGGTFLLTLADRIPAEYGLVKATLIYSSPAMAVGMAAMWVIFASFIRKRKRRADMGAILKEARDMCRQVCSDPDSSPDHKAKARKHVEDFETLNMEFLKDEADVVRAQLAKIR